MTGNLLTSFNRKLITQISASVALLLLAVYSLFLVYGYSLGWHHVLFKLGFIAVGIALLAFVFYILQKFSWNKLTIITTTSIVVLILLFSFAISGLTVDVSYDGQDYQQTAITMLKKGWNPIREELVDDQYDRVWANHYPKAPWYSAAGIYALSNNIQLGRATNFILIFASLFAGFAALLKATNIRTRYVLLIALISAFNPVVIYQSLTFYIDLQAYSLLLICLFGLLLLYEQKADLLSKGILFFAIVLGLNIKFTADAYLLVFLFLTFVFILIKYRKLNAIFAYLVVVLPALLIAIFFVGVSPYLTNTYRNSNPFYPVYGGKEFNQQVIIHGQVPDEFLLRSYGVKLFTSLLGRTQNDHDVVNYKPKLPLYFSRSELNDFSAPDTRIAGWGPWFGASVIVAFVTMVLMMLRNEHKLKFVVFPYLLLLSTILINPESWWARYTPQMWLLPVFVLVAILIVDLQKYKYIFGILAVILIGNMSLVFAANYYYNFKTSAYIKSELYSIVQKNMPIQVSSVLTFTYNNLDRAGIDYQIVERNQLVCEKAIIPGTLFYSDLSCQK